MARVVRGPVVFRRGSPVHDDANVDGESELSALGYPERRRRRGTADAPGERIHAV
jgi:hypothetical protein